MFCPHASDPFVASAFACISVLLLILGLYGLAGHCALCRHRAPMYRLPCLVQRDGGNRVELLPHVRGIFPGPAAGASIYWDADFFRAPYCSLGHGPYPSVRPQEPRAKDAKNLRNPDGSVLSPLAVYWKPDADGILRLTRIEAPGTSADKRREGETRTLLHMTAFAETDILSSVRGDNNCRLVLDAVLFDVKTVLPFRDGPFTRTWPGITMEQMLGIKPTPFGLDVRLTPGAVPEPGTLWYGTRNLDADPVLSESEAPPAPVRK